MNIEMIKQLREKTASGMSACKDALVESGWDFERAVDLIKVRGLVLADARASKPAAEGVVLVNHSSLLAVMCEVNAETDFTSRSPNFVRFAQQALGEVSDWALSDSKSEFEVSPALEAARKDLIATTKENVVIRRWWIVDSGEPKTRIFSYTHPNNKLASLVALRAKDDEQANSKEFEAFGNDLVMQVSAMAPLAISTDKLCPEDVARQKAIFETQVKEMGKDPSKSGKIVDGKMAKWHSEVCLLEQESITTPKKRIKDLLAGAEVMEFHRCVVGEGIEVVKTDLASEVEAMTGVHQHTRFGKGNECLDCHEVVEEITKR